MTDTHSRSVAPRAVLAAGLLLFLSAGVGCSAKRDFTYPREVYKATFRATGTVEATYPDGKEQLVIERDCVVIGGIRPTGKDTPTLDCQTVSHGRLQMLLPFKVAAIDSTTWTVGENYALETAAVITECSNLKQGFWTDGASIIATEVVGGRFPASGPPGEVFPPMGGPEPNFSRRAVFEGVASFSGNCVRIVSIAGTVFQTAEDFTYVG